MIFSRLFKKLGFFKNEANPSDNKRTESTFNVKWTEEYYQVLEFNEKFSKLLSCDRFIARSDYKNLLRYKTTYDFLATLKKSSLLEEYICKNELDSKEISIFVKLFDEIRDLKKESSTVRKHNDDFLNRKLSSEKVYLDNILKACDPNILLDNEQRKVVLSDEDHTLVIAGAGAGKTTTVAAKVRYLVERQEVDPKKILVISFTNKAVEELKERINENLQIPCPITTFHSTGYAILRKKETERKKIVSQGFMYNVISEYLKKKVLSKPEIVDRLILFFGSYFNAPYEGENLNEYFRYVSTANFTTMKSNLHEYVRQVIDRKTQKAQTLKNELVRSMEEVNIANFLYLNQIEYEYEKIYPYHILEARKPYTPDFCIQQGNKVTYIEHFGITQDGRNNRYSQAELDKYKQRVNEKILLHRKHKTDLIYTFSQYNDGRSYLDHLKEELQKRGYALNRRSNAEVYKRIVDNEESKYITRLTILLCTFIGNFKTQGYHTDDFEKLKAKTQNVRTRLFLDICSSCYHEYQNTLQECACIDFEDMINHSAEIIRQKQLTKEDLDFRYIIVDEYQDISMQRYNLISELSKICKAKIVAVGDDWQSIYAFSGSILPLFTQFCNVVGYGEELKITRTYRNAQELIDIAGTFIQKNSSQIRKELKSPKRIDNPVIISTFDKELTASQKEAKNAQTVYIGDAVNNAIEQILEFNAKEGKKGVASILLIGRYGFDARKLCYSSSFNLDEKSGKIYSAKYGNQVKLSFLTAHSSKGLSADNVIIINAKDALYGFPSKIEDDPVLNLVTVNDNSYNNAEERRLFYVALTRTKNRVLIVTPSSKPSEFILELLNEKENYPNVTLKGEIVNNVSEKTHVRNACPICGYPMQIRWNKNYGLKLWICTNDQEVCGFMTNDIKGGELCIQKCDQCNDGYLIVKHNPSRSQYFLGCTNYERDGKGCNKALNLHQYRAQLNFSCGEEDLSFSKPTFKKQPVQQVPEDIPEAIQKEPQTPRKPQSVHSVIHEQQTIEEGEYDISISSTTDLELTDKRLLGKLMSLRYKISMENNVPIHQILSNQMLSALATQKPTTKEEMLEISGIGEVRYEKYGRLFIELIKLYMS